MRFLVLLLLLCTWPSISIADVRQADAAAIDRLRGHIHDIMVENEIPGVAVAVAKNNQILWQEGFGWADLARKRRVHPHTAFALASISKPITATAVMILVDRGRIGLDRPIDDYLGGPKLTAFVGRSEDATVRRVLSHQAGLPWHFNMYYDDEPIKRPSFAESVARYGTIVTVPGETYQYSNFGYALLERAIEDVSQESYPRFLRKEIFGPLGMRDSFVSPPEQMPGDVAVRYMAPGRPVPLFDTDHRGAASVFASADDLARFGLFHLGLLREGPTILSPESLASMHAYGGAIPPGGSRNVLGWEITDINGQRVFRHTGSMPGVDAEMVAVPSQRLVVVVLANRNTDHRREITDRLLRTFGAGFTPPDDRAALAQAAPGLWRGLISLGDEGKVPLVMRSVGNEMAISLNGKEIPIDSVKARWNDFFEIALDGGNLPTKEARRDPHRLRLMLKRRGNVLNGYATTLSRPEPDRWGRTLSYWTELRLVCAASTPVANELTDRGLAGC